MLLAVCSRIKSIILLAIVLAILPHTSFAQANSGYVIIGNAQPIPNGQITPTSNNLTKFPRLNIDEFSSVTATYQLFNNTQQTLVFSDVNIVTLTGANADQFAVALQPFRTINPGASDFININFTPTSAGIKRATVSLSAGNNNFAQPYFFNIEAEAVPSQYVVSGNGINIADNDATPSARDFTDFGSVRSGANSQERPFVIRNTGVTTLNFNSQNSLRLVGANAADFSLNSISSNQIAPGDTALFFISFSPNTTGLKTTTVEINPQDGRAQRFAIQGLSSNQSAANNQEDTEFCSDWNGFLGMTFNIAEFSNLSDSQLQVQTTLYDTALEARDLRVLNVLPGSQSDLLVHDMNGWSTDSLGTICSKVTSSDASLSADDVQGRMLRYKPDGLGSFDFVLSNEFSSPVRGSQFAHFNNFHPSLDPAEIGFFTANWFSIRNSESSPQSGTIIVYASTGEVIETLPLTLGAQGLYDFGTHTVGANQIGVIEWRPASSTASFRTSISRYFYSGPFGTNDIYEAVSLPGLQGTSNTLITPVDTRGQTAVLEITNTEASAANISIVVNTKSGVNVLDSVLPLAAKATNHIVLDSFLTNDLGVAYVKNNTTGKIIVNNLQYIRNSRAGVQSIYGAPAKEGSGSTLLGTYNTFLDQDCNLTLSNNKSTNENVLLTLVNFTGETLVDQQAHTVPADGVLEIDTCSSDTNNSYGTVKIETSTPGSIVANIVRIGLNDNYRIATSVK